MKSYSKILPALLLFAMILGFSNQVAAQDDARGQAVTLYNQAQELAGSNELDDAIATYRDALEIADDNELTDISERIRTNLARVYYSRASRSFQQFQQQKSLEAVNWTIEYFEDAQAAGQ